MTIITRYKCFCCQVSFEKHRIHGFDWKDGVWGDLEFDDPDETGKHICRVCLNELGRMISNVADPEDTEPEPQKAVSLGRNSFAARSLAEQTLAADQAEPESVKNTCCNCASQFLDTQKHTEQCPKHPLAAAKAEIQRLQEVLSIHESKSTNCYSVWHGQLFKCFGANTPYEDAKKTTFPVMLGANDFRLMVEAMEITKAIETLREGGGRLSVHQIDELDPRTSIGVCGDWTHEEWQTFRGDTLHAALAWAVEAMLEKR